ncbi:MAG: hypothetical protein JXD22_07050 [Sedimentisphaerales bacterium]|nr:hypothetical protein [Sedimentisphaerales bacterium]
MKRTNGILFLFILPILCLCLPVQGAGYTFDFNPLLITEETYDDNIFLTSSNKRSDWITSISPGFITSLTDPRINFTLEYHPDLLYYLHNPEFDSTGHTLNFTTSAELTSRLTFSLDETYTRSNIASLEEFADTDYERDARRDAREIFNRNVVVPRLEYRFGTDNSVRLYYRNSCYRSEDPTEDDYRENYGEAQLDYWFNVKNGISLLGHFIKGNFDEDTDLISSLDITARYRYRFSPHVEIYGEYGTGASDFEEERIFLTLENGKRVVERVEDNEDYDLHKFNFGFEWQLPDNLQLEGSLGYFWRYGRGNRDEQGINSLLAIEKAINDVTLHLSWTSGYSANYFAIRDSGFSQFWRVRGDVTYNYQEKLEFRLGGAYGYEEYTDIRTTDPEEALEYLAEDGRENYTYSARAGIVYHILRHYGFLEDLSIEFEFRHIENDANTSTDRYISNRSIARATARF